MKLSKYSVLVTFIALSTIFLVSCGENGDGFEPESANGPAVVSHVQLTGTAATPVTTAKKGAEVVIIGENLADTRQVLFNDQLATLAPTWVTNRSLFVAVPTTAPGTITDKIYLIDVKGNTTEFSFVVN